jgi:TPR repeat protein
VQIVSKDDEKAVALFTKLAEQNNLESMINLAN